MIWLVIVVFLLMLGVALLFLLGRRREQFLPPMPTISSLTLPYKLPWKNKLNTDTKNLVGFVDLHTHLMSHLGFGGHLLHGAPDVGTLMPAGTIYTKQDNGVFLPATYGCNATARAAKNTTEAIGNCRATHGGWNPINNTCGNLIREFVIGQVEKTNNSHGHENLNTHGYPSFTDWPRYDDLLHQQMWVDWIKRAYDGGLRMLVAHAVNTYTLAKGLQSPQPYDDKTSVDLQLDEIKKFAARHSSWMEIAYSSSDLRRIIGTNDKLAIIMGIECDDIGNFLIAKKVPTAKQVEDEVQRLYNKGVRYMFPIHVIDNHFGGTAAYNPAFFIANRVHFGHWLNLQCAPSSEIGQGVTKTFNEKDFLATALNAVMTSAGALLAGGDGFGETQPLPKCAAGKGQMNTRGLQSIGKVLLTKMKNLHMLIDVDHMSRVMLGDVLNYLPSTYPLMSGHTKVNNLDHNAENSKTSAFYTILASRGGMAGITLEETTPKIIKDAEAILDRGVPIGMGSDFNGYVKMPPPPSTATVVYGSSFPKCTTGTKTWDYNKEGMAHIGLYPDLLRDMQATKGNRVVTALFQGAEAMAKVWEKCEKNK